MKFEFITQDLSEDLTKIVFQVRDIILSNSDEIAESILSNQNLKIATYSVNNEKDILFGIQPEENSVKLFIKKAEIALELDFTLNGTDNNTHLLIQDDFDTSSPEFKALIYKSLKG